MLLGISTLTILVIFFVPEVHEKMFIDSSKTVSTINSSDLNFDTIQSNGRAFIWEQNLSRFFSKDTLFGSGLGESVEYTKNNFTVKMIHSDYVQILCDMGLIGICLFGLFCLIAILKVISRTWIYKSNRFVKLSGSMTLGSCAGVLFSMAFDNVVAYAQQCFVIPFIFIGIFLKAIDLEKTHNI